MPVAAVISTMVCSFESYIFSAVSILPGAAFGRPPLRPLTRAASSPDFVRCLMRSLSNWERPAKIVKSRLPCGVVVSSQVSRSDFIEAPASCTLSMMANSSLTDLPSRVSSVITTVSPSLKASSIRSSSGRCTFVPDTFSLYILSHPACRRLSHCPSRFCPDVDTLAYPIVMAEIVDLR